jgi:phosphate transport system protein
MPAHYLRESDKLKKQILTLCAIVEENVQRAVMSIEKRDEDLAKKVISGDQEIDKREIEVEEECLKILALYQPVATDLRFIVAVMKMNNDLERIGDLAVNIAERSIFLSTQNKIDLLLDFPQMVEKTRTMLKNCLDALINMDARLAYSVLAADNEVDKLNGEMYDIVEKEIKKAPERIKVLINLLSASRHLERIADHATNIAEDVIYLIEGRIVRHKTEEFEEKRHSN